MLTVSRQKKKHQPLLGGTEPRSSQPARRPSKRRNPYATCVVQFGHNGKIYFYLNAGIPDNRHPSEGICETCKHAYSSLINSGRGQCQECDDDVIAMAAMRLEQAGINLGWGFSEHLGEYERESHRKYRAC